MRWSVRIQPALVIALALAAVHGQWVRAQNPPGRGAAPAQAGQAPAREQTKTAPVDPRKLDQLLDQWERNSANLTTLDVEMERNDRSQGWDEDEHYKGRALFKSPNLARLSFEKEKVAVDPKTGKPVIDPQTGKPQKQSIPHELIICTGTEVWQYRQDTLQIFVYPLDKGVQQRALEEGPLPFLFNFKKDEAKKRYDMTLAAENEDYSMIRIVPKLDIDKESFKMAYVWLDRKQYLLPKRVSLVATDGKSGKDFVIKKQTPNDPKGVADSNFEGKPLRGWKLVRNPGGEEAPAPKAAARPPQPASRSASPGTGAGGGNGTTTSASPGEQPAMRPRLFGGRRN